MQELNIDPDEALKHFQVFHAALVSGLGARRIDGLRACRTSFRSGSVLAVHAGIHPYTDMETSLAQTWSDFPEDTFAAECCPFWVREAFLNHDPAIGYPEGVFVVHGHTPSPTAPDLTPIRLGLDAHSWKSGKVLMAEIRGSRVRVHQAAAD